MKLHRFMLPIILVCVAPRPASAQSPDADRAAARTLAFEAQAALEKKDYARAADRFSRADALVHAPTLLLGLARAQVGLGQLVAAHESYARVVREGVPAKATAAFMRAVEDAKRELDALEPRMPHLVIEVKGVGNPQVTLDGAPLANAALGVKWLVDPGTRVVVASAEGFERREVSVEVSEGETKPVTMELIRAKVAAPPPPLPAPPPPGSSARKIATLAVLGLGGAGLSAGAVMGGVVLRKQGALLEQCPKGVCKDSPATRDAVTSYNGLRTASVATLAVGGAAAITGLALLFTAPRPTGSVRPQIGLGYVGLEGGF